MSDKQKIKLIKILSGLLGLMVFIIVEAFCFAPNRLKVTYHSYSSTDLPASFDGYRVSFFSDIHYGMTINESNISKVIDKLNLLQSDVVLFGGDLVDSLVDIDCDMELLAEQLGRIEAKGGKYAVLGNHDYENKQTTAAVVKALEDGGFKMITNTSLRIHNGTNESIRVVGLDSSVLGYPSVTLAYDGVRSSDFTLLVTHTPDNVLNVDDNLLDLSFGGHSHGSQIYIPLISNIFYPPGCRTYHRGIYRLDDDGVVYVSNGIGTTKIKARLFSTPEIVVYTLKKAE